MKDKVVVVDLDGTLYFTNTFHKWIFFCLKKSLFINLIDTIKILFFIFLRVFKQITHKELKYNILKITEKEDYIFYMKDFLNILEKFINKKALNLLEDKNSIYILATAAPFVYTKYISIKYNFNFFTSTPSINYNDWYENIREVKRDKIVTLLKKNNIHLKIDLFITDHYDDIYLAKISKKTIVFNPSLKTISVFKKNQINFLVM